jgi:hypothetical protein
MKNISIDNLTEEQVQLLDTMWLINSSEDLHIWMSTLTKDQQQTVVSLREMVRLAVIDDDVNADVSLHEANVLLEQFDICK